MQFHLQLQFFQLFGIQFAWSIKHHIATTVVLGECDTVTDAVETSHDADKAIETEGQTSVRGCTVLEGINQEAELCHRTLGCEAQYLEHLLLQLAVVDTQ